MLALTVVSTLLVLFGNRLPPYLVYAILFCGLFCVWLTVALPVWMLAGASFALWMIVELGINRVSVATQRRMLVAWKLGNFRLAVAV